MPISEVEQHMAERVLSAYCAGKTDPAIRDKVEIVYRLEGNCAYISERRPNWRDKSVYRDHDVAKFRFMVKDRRWTLFWRDGDLAWHQYADVRPARDLAELLPIVDSEPIFYG